MEPVSTTQGSLAAVGTSLAKVGSTSIAFAAVHPATMGFVAGLATYFAVSKAFKKRKPVFAQEPKAA